MGFSNPTQSAQIRLTLMGIRGASSPDPLDPNSVTMTDYTDRGFQGQRQFERDLATVAMSLCYQCIVAGG